MKKINIRKTAVLALSSTLLLGVGLGVGLGIKTINESGIYFNIGSTKQKININDIRNESFGDIEGYNSQLSTDSKWMTVAFMNSVMTGNIDGEKDENGNWGEGSAFNPGEKDDWIVPDIEKFNVLYDLMIEVKLFTETTGQSGGSRSFREYLVELRSGDASLLEVTQPFIDNNIKTFWEAKESKYAEEYAALVEVLGEKIDFKLEITDFLYNYSWLWQESGSQSFDYHLTNYLYSNKPILLWEMDIIDSSPTGISNSFRNEVDSWGGTVDNDTWNEYIETNDSSNDHRLTKGDKYASFTEGGALGFSGIQYKNNAEDINSIVDDEFWDYSNIFGHLINENGEAEDAIVGGEHFDNIEDGEISLYHNKKGENIIEDGSEGKLIGYSMLYPFAFATEYNGETAANWEYSINGYKTLDNDGKTIIKQEGEVGEEINYFEVISGANNGTGDYNRAQLMILYSLFKESKDEIINSTYRYWNNQGFSIELKGTYENDYGSLIDERLQKK